MKKIKIALATLLFCTLLSSTPLKSYAISANGAILMEQHSGRVLFEKNAHTPMRIASITKIMTAILAVESGKLDEYVNVSERAVKAEGSSLYLKPEQKVKLLDLTYGLMLRSGNDAAVAIAEHVGGSLEGFVNMMNKKAKQLGMKNTVFANPHGLDDHENHYSTAYDMALVTQYAMQNETYAKIVGTKKYTTKLPDQGNVTWINKNRLLTQFYPYCTGGKTGYTQRAKRTLVSTASKDNLDLIAVTINDRNDWKDHMNLFDHAFVKFKPFKIIEKGEITNLEDDFYVDKIKSKNDFIYPLTKDEQKGIYLKYELVNPNNINYNYDITKPIGKVKVHLNDEIIWEAPLFLTDFPIKEEKNWWEKLKQSFSH